jgi:hypothetical protein
MRLVYVVMESLGCSFSDAMTYAQKILLNWDKIRDAAESETVETVWLDKK